MSGSPFCTAKRYAEYTVRGFHMGIGARSKQSLDMRAGTTPSYRPDQRIADRARKSVEIRHVGEQEFQAVELVAIEDMMHRV